MGDHDVREHTNLGTADDNLSEPLERMSLTGDSAGDPALAPTAAVRNACRTAKGKGKGNRADQFCIYRTSDGANIPATAIEYKAPHKLSQDEVATGLMSKIQPERDVINKDGEGTRRRRKRPALLLHDRQGYPVRVRMHKTGFRFPPYSG